MDIQIKSLFPTIAPQLLDELAPHPGPEEVSTEPMPATVRAKVVLKPLGGCIMQARAPGSFHNQVIDSRSVKPLSFGIQEQGGQSLLIDILPDGQPAPESDLS